MRPIDMHLSAAAGERHSPFGHLKKTLAPMQYRKPFIATGLRSVGGFLMMPFSSAFIVNNTAVSQAELPLVFMFTAIASIREGTGPA